MPLRIRRRVAAFECLAPNAAGPFLVSSSNREARHIICFATSFDARSNSYISSSPSCLILACVSDHAGARRRSASRPVRWLKPMPRNLQVQATLQPPVSTTLKTEAMSLNEARCWPNPAKRALHSITRPENARLLQGYASRSPHSWTVWRRSCQVFSKSCSLGWITPIIPCGARDVIRPRLTDSH